MKITRIDVRNYRGIEHVDETIGPRGAIVSGGNGEGKTSVLRAIRAALVAQDIGEDAIRLGHDKAEILIDLDALSVRRVITETGSRLTVTNRDGMAATKPQTYLAELLGTSPLDPLDLLLAKPKDRRARVLAALPIALTLEQLRTWAPDAVPDDVAGHGLEALARVRARYYTARTAANAKAKETAEDVRRLEAEHMTLRAQVPAGALPLADAEHEVASAREQLAQLRTQDAEARKAGERGGRARERVEALTREAEELRRQAGELQVPPTALDEAREQVTKAKAEVERLVYELARARGAVEEAHANVTALDEQVSEVVRLGKVAESRERQAAELRETLAEIATAPVEPAVLTEAEQIVAAAERKVAAARSAEAAESARTKLTDAETRKAAADAEAARLDGIVKALTDDAPTALLASAQGIPGLGVEGDDVTLDGKRLEALSGAEQIRFCVEIARRLNAKSRILIVDGLERLDVDHREAFVRAATRDDFQLLATTVSNGARIFAAIEADA